MKKVLFVDDEPGVLQGIVRNLRGKLEIFTATSGAEGLAQISSEGPFAVVVADMRMPGMDGVEFLRRVQVAAPRAVRMMLTGNSDQETAVLAVNKGSIFRFACKPCPTDRLLAMLEEGIQQFQVAEAERLLLEDTLGGCLRLLTELLAAADSKQYARSLAIQDLAQRYMATSSQGHAWAVNAAAILAPIGLVAIPALVVARAGLERQLTGAELDMLTRIPQLGYDLLRRVPRLEPVADIVRYQHKNFDGSGFPVDDVAGVAIPWGARLLRILTDYVVATQGGKNPDQALLGMQRNKGLHDPDLLEAVAYFLRQKAEERALAGAEATMEVALADLAIGQVLAASVKNGEDTVLVVSGTKVTYALRERLLNFSATVGVREPLLVHIDP